MALEISCWRLTIWIELCWTRRKKGRRKRGKREDCDFEYCTLRKKKKRACFHLNASKCQVNCMQMHGLLSIVAVTQMPKNRSFELNRMQMEMPMIVKQNEPTELLLNVGNEQLVYNNNSQWCEKKRILIQSNAFEQRFTVNQNWLWAQCSILNDHHNANQTMLLFLFVSCEMEKECVELQLKSTKWSYAMTSIVVTLK